MPKTVTHAFFTMGIEHTDGDTSTIRPMLDVQGSDGRKSWETWGWSSWCTGTLDGLVRAYLKGECPAGIVLDRLEECPEECSGPHSVLTLAIPFLRARLPVESLYVDPK